MQGVTFCNEKVPPQTMEFGNSGPAMETGGCVTGEFSNFTFCMIARLPDGLEVWFSQVQIPVRPNFWTKRGYKCENKGIRVKINYIRNRMLVNK